MAGFAAAKRWSRAGGVVFGPHPTVLSGTNLVGDVVDAINAALSTDPEWEVAGEMEKMEKLALKTQMTLWPLRDQSDLHIDLYADLDALAVNFRDGWYDMCTAMLHSLVRPGDV
jgi:hypothetical protein